MKPDAFLANAERIYNSHNQQPDACASRAIAHACYYAVFHFVCGKLGLQVSDTATTNHGTVEREISNYGGDDAAMLSAKQNYSSLKGARMTSDYYLRGRMDAPMAMQALSRAKRIFRLAGITPTAI